MAPQAAARAEQAASLLLENLEETARRIAELDAERATAARRRAELVLSLQSLLRTLPPGPRERLGLRLAVLAELPQAPARLLRGSLRDVIAACETDTIRASEVTRHIRALGHPVKGTYGGATLGKLEATGHVTRIERGIYRINRAHPELMAQRRGSCGVGPELPTLD